MAVSIIESNECLGCGVCADTCPLDVLEVNGKASVCNEDACVDCGACAAVCPTGFLSL